MPQQPRRRCTLNLNQSQRTFPPRKKGQINPRFCGHFIPLLTVFLSIKNPQTGEVKYQPFSVAEVESRFEIIE